MTSEVRSFFEEPFVIALELYIEQMIKQPRPITKRLTKFKKLQIA